MWILTTCFVGDSVCICVCGHVRLWLGGLRNVVDIRLMNVGVRAGMLLLLQGQYVSRVGGAWSKRFMTRLKSSSRLFSVKSNVV